MDLPTTQTSHRWMPLKVTDGLKVQLGTSQIIEHGLEGTNQSLISRLGYGDTTGLNGIFLCNVNPGLINHGLLIGGVPLQ